MRTASIRYSGTPSHPLPRIGQHSRGRGIGISAFTLFELLVVIAIISVLASLLLPVIGMARDGARRIVCGSNMRQMGMAFELYRVDNSGEYPLVYLPGNPISMVSPWNAWTYYPDQGRWFQFLEPYTETYKVFNCPASSRILPDLMVLDAGVPGYNRGTAKAYWGSPGCALCLTAYNATTWGRRQWTATPPMGPMTINKVDTYLAGTGLDRNRSPVIFDGLHWDDQPTAASSYSRANQYGVWWPHRGKRANMVFSDGHVENKAYTSVTSFLPFQVGD